MVLVEHRQPIQSRKDKSSKRFYRSMSYFILLGQFFGLFPVQGSFSTTISDLKFSWCTFRGFYSVLNAFCSFVFAVLFLSENFRVGWDYWTFIVPVFYNGIVALMQVLFIKLARNWLSLMKVWTRIDISMEPYGWPQSSDTRIRILLVVFTTLIFVETGLSKASQLVFSAQCKSETQGVFEYLITNILYAPLFVYINYSTWIGIILLFINYNLTFAWSYGDIFLMQIGIALASRFQQINLRLKHFVKENVNSLSDWRSVRETFNNLALLTKTVDSEIENITFLCFANNLYFLMTQMFNSLRYRRFLIDRIYFVFSSLFLILRTACASLYLAWINDESKEPMHILSSLPSSCYNIEMASAVLTYELILIQLNESVLEEEANRQANLNVTIC